MEQERQNTEAEFQSPTMPILCANNCGFFGSAATNNLCSKCYKEYFLNKSKAAMETLIVAPPTVDAKPILAKKPSGGDGIIQVAILGDEGASSGEAGATKSKKNPSRCGFCNKKVGLMGFNCRCGEVFCSLHRYSDKHDCSYDYRGAGQDAIAKANPIVKADKVDKI